MAKLLNLVLVNLLFTADTKLAKLQLEGLQLTLNNLVRNPSGNLDKLMAAAAKSAAELSSHLAKATNQTTGTLDFSKLNLSILKSGKSISEYGAELLKLGPAGHLAFSQLTTAITNSEIPMRRMSKTLLEMGTVLSNTIRWQISSSAIHAMQGAILGAYRYALDLNKSLNDIRIVTGQSAEQMEKFAERANRAAKNLSSTTLDYTNASLIYYQLGLTDEEVAARTDVTIKMANAAGESAEKVSSQLTAVWNNFAKGGENLEYYADVMTALGAATASSTDEISQGLEKFASVADTVGLSYEYAAAALATVTATTRLSADVVGNAFKTLFARLEGLKLGETLDDGTDLNKYSQALSAVGVSIKDTDGELRNMDNILDDLAGKWLNLSKDQKMALAQTVAGVRLYTQLIALMDNWDFMERNIETARKSSGTLQKLADIYAESWEAALKRVLTALLGVYNALIKDDFFITILNGTEKAITGVNNLIKAFGGLPGILSTIGVVVTLVFSKLLSEGLLNTVYNLRMLIPSEREKVALEKYNSINKLSDSFYATEGPDASLADKARYQALLGTLELQKAYVEKAKDLNSLEISTAELLMALNEARREAVELAASLLDVITKEKDDFFLNNDFSGTTYAVNDITELFNAIELYKSGVAGSEEELKIHNIAINEHILLLQELLKEAKSLSILSESDKKTKQDLIILILREISVLKTGSQIATQEFNSVQNINKALNEASISEKVFLDWLNESRYAAMSWSDAIVLGANSLGQLLRGINSLKGIWNTLNDDNLSFFEKISSATISLSFGLPALIKGFSGAKDSILGFSANILKTINATKALGEVNNIALASLLLLNESIDASSATYAILLAVSKLNISEKEKDTLVTAILNALKAKGTVLTEAEIIALIKENTVLASSIVLKEKLAGITSLLNIKYIAIAAAIAAVVAVVYAMVLAYHEAENTAKTLNEQTETLKTRYLELSQSAEDLKNKISNYEEGIASLKKLNSSTEEYKETLKKTNEQAEELIESLGAFSNWTYDSNGAIIIKDLDKYLLQANLQANLAKKDYALGQLQSALASLRSDMIVGLRNILGPITTSSADNLIKQLTTEKNLSNSKILNIANEIIRTTSDSNGDYVNSITQEQAQAVNNLIIAYQEAASKVNYYSRLYFATDIEDKYRDQINTLATNTNGEIDQTIANAIINVASANINTEDVFNDKDNTELARVIDSGRLSLQDLIDIFGILYFSEKSALTGNDNIDATEKEKIQKYGELIGQEGLHIGTNGSLYSKDNTELEKNFDVDIALKQLWLRNKYNDLLAERELAGIDRSTDLWRQLRSNNLSTPISTSIMLAIAGDGTNFDITGLINHYTDYQELENIGEDISNILGGKGGKSGAVFIANFKKLLKDFDFDSFIELKNAQGTAEAKALGLDENEFSIYRDLLKESSSLAEKTGKDYARYVEGVNAASIANKRLEKGVSDICKKWKDYDVVMSDSNVALEDLSRVLAEVNPSVLHMLNLSAEEFALLPPDFALKHWDLITLVTDGVEGAADKLRDIAGKEILLKIASDDTALQTSFMEIQAEIAEFDKKEFEIGVSLDPEDEKEIYAAFNRLLASGKFTAELIQAYAKSMGYDVELKQEYITTDFEVPEIKAKGNPLLFNPAVMAAETESLNLSGQSFGYDVSTKKYGIKTPVFPAAVKVITPNGSYGGSSLVNTNGVTGSKNTGSSGGGKGSGSSKKETKTAERYKTVNDQIEKIKDSYDDANKEADRLFGASRWAEIEKENLLLEEQNDLLGKKREEALLYLNNDKNNLLAAAEAAGIKLEFDENGIISNYKSAFEEYYTRYNASELTDEQKEILKKLEDALKLYDDTRKIIQDIENEQIDNNHKIQDNNFTITKEVIDIRKLVEANRLLNIQNLMNILGDDWPKVVEIFGLLTSLYATLSDGIMNIDTSKLTDLNAQFDDFTNETARARYGLNNIIEGLKMTLEEAQSTLDALLSWNKAMSEYYNNALSKYTDGLNFLTKQIDHAYNQLEHYNKMLSLWGKENDYRALDIILRGLLNVANNNKLVAEDNYYMLELLLIAAREAFNNASDEEARQAIYNSLLKPAEEAFEDAANTLWSAQEKYAEIAKAVYENLLAEAKQAAELALTAGKGFDALKESMDLASKYQDEYLTKTNLIYETEKLLRDINKDIDKTDNLASKSRLKNFADEITAMKELGLLSLLELKIAQARYALLQAQIALEEAQNAKSTVRLQRDNEGNYGYVYTADANQIGEAELNLADKTNDLYNLVLENSNNYALKMIELRLSTIDLLAALDKDAEDYEERKKEIMDRAMALYKTYSTEYGIAMHWLGVEAATDTNEAWTTEFIDPATYSLENFRDNITEYMNTSEDNFKEFQETLENDEMTKESLNDLANKVNDVTTATDDLKEAAQNYVANGSDILDLINAETVAWAEALLAVLDYASALADLAKRSGETAANLGLEDTDYSLKMWETYLNGGNMSLAMSLRDTKIKNNPNAYTDLLNTLDVADLIKNYSVLGFSMGMTQDQMDRELRELGFKGIKKKYSLDTGGYTGSWGSDGRLAMLHEKELVLNKEDTKNFLAGVEILRSITGAIDLLAAAAGTATPISTLGFNLGGQTLLQSVTISAEFPNATNHSEIEEAFNNLINRASQYAHRQSFCNQV